MHVYWLEQVESDVPRTDEWLSQPELARLKSFAVPKRRGDWRLGRWTAKCAVASYLQLPSESAILARVEIRAAISGAPEVFLDDHPLTLPISLSHRAGRSLCAVSGAEIALGCDLELIEPHSAAFINDYFTHTEQQLIAAAPPSSRTRLVAMFWSAKESALKALHEGLRIDTRSLAVAQEADSADVNGWSPLRIHGADSQSFDCWWQQSGAFVRTIAAAAPLRCPIQLNMAPHSSSACA